MNKIGYIVPRGVPKGVIEAQLLTPANVIKDLGGDVVVFYPEGFEVEILKKNIEYVAYKSLFDIKSQILKCDYVYIRQKYNFLSLFTIAIFRDTKLFFDFRGLGSLDSNYSKKRIFRKKFHELIEIFILFVSDEVSCVTDYMKDYIKSFSNRKIHVYYGGVQDVVKNERLLINDPIRIVFIGGYFPWHNLEDLFNSLNALSDLERKIKVDVITRDIDDFNSLLRGLNLNYDYNIFSLEHKKVLASLDKYDFGVMKMDGKSLRNRISSPIKLVEYISRGVVPIIEKNCCQYGDELFDLNLAVFFKENSVDLNRMRYFIENRELVLEQLYNFSKKFEFKKQFRNHIFLS